MPDTEQQKPEDKIQEAAIVMFGHLEGQLSRAGTESRLTLALEAILVAAITSFLTKGGGKAFANWNPLDWHTYTWAPIETIFAIAAGILLMVSLFFALLVIRPKFNPPASDTNLFYFGSIVKAGLPNNAASTDKTGATDKVKPANRYAETFQAQTQQELTQGLLEEVYAKADIAKGKFNKISLSVSFLIASLAFWAVFVIIMVFS